MRHHHNSENDSPDYVTGDDLNEGNISAVGHCRNADDREGACFRGYDGKPDSPPRNIFAAQEVVARSPLVFAKPQPEANDAAKINGDNQPVSGVKKSRAHRTEVQMETGRCARLKSLRASKQAQ